MKHFLLAVLLAVSIAPAWGADPAPAAHAGDYSAAPPAAGAPVDPATQAGLDAAAKLKAASKPWYTDLGSAAVVGGVAALVVLEKAAPQLLMRFLPMAGPYGGVIQLVLQLLLMLVKPKAQKDAEQLQSDHADAFRAVASTIQTVSNAAPVSALKERLLTHLDPDVRATIDAYVAELKALGINHDAPGSTPATTKPAASESPMYSLPRLLAACLALLLLGASAFGAVTQDVSSYTTCPSGTAFDQIATTTTEDSVTFTVGTKPRQVQFTNTAAWSYYVVSGTSTKVIPVAAGQTITVPLQQTTTVYFKHASGTGVMSYWMTN